METLSIATYNVVVQCTPLLSQIEDGNIEYTNVQCTMYTFIIAE